MGPAGAGGHGPTQRSRGGSAPHSSALGVGGGAAGSFLPLGSGGRRGRSRGERGGEVTRRAGRRPQGRRGSVRSIPRPGTTRPGRRRSARRRPHPGPPPTARGGRPRRAGARPAGEISPARSGQCIFPPARGRGRGVGSCGLGGWGGERGPSGGRVQPRRTPTARAGAQGEPQSPRVPIQSLLPLGSFLLGNHKSEPSEWPR